jgi:hypothetical protein
MRNAAGRDLPIRNFSEYTSGMLWPKCSDVVAAQGWLGECGKTRRYHIFATAFQGRGGAVELAVCRYRREKSVTVQKNPAG